MRQTDQQDKTLSQRVLANTFVRRVLLLLTGSVIAQALPILATPILSRIYNPEEMGALGLFVATITTIGTLVTLRYENAILLPKDNRGAAHLLAAITLSSLVISATFALTLLVWDEGILELIGASALKPYYLLLPIGIAILGISQGLNVWLIRQTQFRELTYARISQSATSASLQLGSGFWGFSASGLILGQVAGQLVGTFRMIRSALKTEEIKSPNFRWQELTEQTKRYKQFPLYSLPADLINAFASSLPFFLLGKFFGSPTVGLYAMMQRVTMAPVALVGNAVSDVFREKAALEYRTAGDCRETTKRTFLGLLAISTPVATVIFFWGETLFAFIFGPSWAEAGVYASLIAPLIAIRFACSPVGYVLYIAEKQRADLAWQAALLAANAGALLLGAMAGDAKLCITLFSCSYSVMYLIYAGLSYYYAKSDRGPIG